MGLAGSNGMWNGVAGVSDRFTMFTLNVNGMAVEA